MSACLQVGNLLFTGEQLVAALTRYGLLESLLGQIRLDLLLPALTEEDVLNCIGWTGEPPEDFNRAVSTRLVEHQISAEYFKQVVLRKVRIRKLQRDRFDPQIDSIFMQRKAEFDQVEFSLLQISDSARAHDLWFMLRDDQAQWASLAPHSEGVERDSEGWMGPVKLASLPPLIQQVFVPSAIGVIPAPIRVGQKFWIVRLERFWPARLTDALRVQIREQLFERWVQSLAKALLADPQTVKVLPAHREEDCA